MYTIFAKGHWISRDKVLKSRCQAIHFDWMRATVTDVLQTTGAAWGTGVAGSLIARPRAEAGLAPLPLPPHFKPAPARRLHHSIFISHLSQRWANAARHCRPSIAAAVRARHRENALPRPPIAPPWSPLPFPPC